MKSFKFNFFVVLSLVAATLFITSCKNEPCGNACPVGYECKNDKCVVKDACALITCPEGYVCKEGTCIADNPVEDISGTIATNTTWTADKIYELNNKVVVQAGATLTIEPGTIIKGLPGQGSLASALIIAKGGKIIAEGTAEKPIIFTAQSDNISVGQTSGTNLKASDRGLWGGVIVLGDAPSSVKSTDKEGQIEGVPADIPNTKYGGDNAADNSGVIKYVSIRHGGIKISDDNEINGLTLGGVGSETVIENVEVISNLDDGIEWFGGTVNVKNAVVAYCGDDALDLDQNYAGTIDNAIVVQDAAAGDHDKALEFDGPEGSTYTDGKFTLKNSTFISKGGAGTAADLKDKAQGTIENCSWRGYTKYIKVRANFEDDCTAKTDAYDNMVATPAKLVVKNSEIVGLANMNDFAGVYTKKDCPVTDAMQTAVNAAISSNGNNGPSTPSKGADDSVFGWTWTKANGGF